MRGFIALQWDKALQGFAEGGSCAQIEALLGARFWNW
jgi:hypothetical protein